MVTSMTTAGLLEIMPWLRFFGNKAYEGLVNSRKAREVLFDDHLKLAKVVFISLIETSYIFPRGLFRQH